MNFGGKESVESCVEEFLARLRAGEGPDVAAFASEHPSVAGELLELLPLLAELETDGPVGITDGPRDEAPPDLRLSDYRIERLLGRGGMGSVWAARQVSLNRTVAVKVLSETRRMPARWLDDFACEARIVAQLHHPNIVKVYGAGISEGKAYYAMECVAGPRFDQARFPDARSCVTAVLQAADALAYAHRCGVLHRDVKPSNLMFDADGTVRVTDFGLAVLTDAAPAADARDGTLRYMAPERILHGRMTFAADQYALGVALWELLSHRRIFADASGSELRRRICSAGVPPLAGSGADGDLAAVVARSTAISPERRYADMAAFADDLRRWLDHDWVRAAPPSGMRRLRLWMARNPRPAALAGGALALALALVASLAAGFARTSAQRDRAERTVAVADCVLENVFRHVSSQPPSRDDAALLAALLPYYGRLAAERGGDPARLADANAILGTCAFRAGDYALAEAAWRRVVAGRPSPEALNRLAEALRRLGKAEEARKISESVVAGYASSSNRTDRFAAVCAQTDLERDGGSVRNLREALAGVRELLREDPDNPDYRFREALLLAELPRTGGGSDGDAPAVRRLLAVRTIRELLDSHPDRTDYGCALLSLETRRLRSRRDAVARDEAAQVAAIADRLLGRFPNVPDVVSAGLAYRTAYANFLRRSGARSAAAKEEARTAGILELLSGNADPRPCN